MKQLLALGTVITARVNQKENLDAKFMIIGYYPKNEKTGKVYDYMGAVYPIGYSFSDASVGINEEAITSVLYEGYKNDVANRYTMELPEMMERIRKTIENHQTATDTLDVEDTKEFATMLFGNPDEAFG